MEAGLMLSWYGGALVQSATTPGRDPVAGGPGLAGAAGDDGSAPGVVGPAGGLAVAVGVVTPHAARSKPRASSAQAAGVLFNIRMLS
jgi:hypothetical protein